MKYWISIFTSLVMMWSLKAQGNSPLLIEDENGTTYCGRVVDRANATGSLREVPADVVELVIEWCDIKTLANLCRLSHSLWAVRAMRIFHLESNRILLSVWGSLANPVVFQIRNMHHFLNLLDLTEGVQLLKSLSN